jgi:poly-gamma-glutamate system protein
MNKLNLNIRLLIAFMALLAGTIISESFSRKSQPLEYTDLMKESVSLTGKWFNIIKEMKQEKGIESDARSNVPNNWMIGNDWSEITTTLGSLDAKETSTNPDFSALIIRLLHEAGMKNGDKAGVIISGSFPSLAISVLAALQTIGIDAEVMSSLGASTYGANQPGATWTDMETVLRNKGGLRYHSGLVSIGAGEDSGSGLSEEGLSLIRYTAIRNNIDLYIPETLTESIDKRFEIFKKSGISILINIGGNQTALGKCSHSTGIPNGLNTKLTTCTDNERGLIFRMNETGIPIINLLDIKELAARYGIAVSPGTDYIKSENLFNKTTSNRTMMSVILVLSIIPLYFLRKID